MSEGYSRERAVTARIIEKHLRRIIAEAIWKGYPPDFLAGKAVDAGSVHFILTPPLPGGAGMLCCVDDKGARETVAENPSLIGPAKTALVLLREYVDGLPPLQRCIEKLTEAGTLARLRTVVEDAHHRGTPLFRLLYHAENPLGTGDGGVHELIFKETDAKEPGYVDTTIALLVSRGSVDEVVPSLDQIYSVYHTLSMLALLEENTMLVREYGKSIPFRDRTGAPDLKEMEGVLSDRYWEETIGDISLLTHAQQYEFFDNIGRYFNDPAHRLMEIEKGGVDITLAVSQGNPVDRSTYYAETGSVLKNLRLGKLKSWAAALETISATLGTADRTRRSLAPFMKFTTFAGIPDPAGGPSIASWGGMIDSTPVLFPVKLLAALRSCLSGKDDDWSSFIRTMKEYPLKIARTRLKALEEAMTSGANSELARIMAGEKTKRTTRKKEVAAERKKVMDALKEIATGLEKALTEALSLNWPHGFTEFSIPFAFSGSHCVISGEVSQSRPEIKLCELKFTFAHITVLASRAAKCESIMKRLLDNGDVAEHVDQAAGGPAPTSVCPPLAAAINNPAGFVDALHAAVDAFVEQKLASAFSVKEQYHNALSRHFPEDMFEEYCSAGPGM